MTDVKAKCQLTYPSMSGLFASKLIAFWRSVEGGAPPPPPVSLFESGSPMASPRMMATKVTTRKPIPIRSFQERLFRNVVGAEVVKEVVEESKEADIPEMKVN